MTIAAILALLVAAFLAVNIWGALVFILFMVLVICEWLQSISIAKNPGKWTDTSRFLGASPSMVRVHCWFATLFVGSVVLLSYTTWPFLAGVAVEAFYVWHNRSLGIPFAKLDGGLLK